MRSGILEVPEEVADILDDLTNKYEKLYPNFEMKVYSIADIGKFILFSYEDSPLCSVTYVYDDVWTSYYEPEIKGVH